jgi:demethylmenaquinone methyltransferase/2-methoxy-6-polyprenyl-1,4-benzoquinol methylase
LAGEDLLTYYARRARENEQVYEKPERQADLVQVRTWLRDALAGHRILEVACGTGYWTAELAPVAAAIVATDANPEVLALARQKPYPADRVRLEIADAYALADVPGAFTAGLAAFWWSHVAHERQNTFLSGLHARLGARATVVLIDNRFVPGSSTPITRRDEAGNTYQQRRLADGTVHEVLKNFPTPAELETALAPVAQELNVIEFAYYWGVRYRVASAA